MKWELNIPPVFKMVTYLLFIYLDMNPYYRNGPILRGALEN